jgi:DNA mismatch repair protein MutS
MDVALINKRLDCIQHMLDHPTNADTLREALRQVPDLDRALSRIALDRAGPRDLVSIRSGLTQASDISLKYDRDALPDLMNDALKNPDRDLMNWSHCCTMHWSTNPRYCHAMVVLSPQAMIPSWMKPANCGTEGRGIIAKMQQEYIELTEISIA